MDSGIFCGLRMEELGYVAVVRDWMMMQLSG
jgi:hypothetical protein